MLPHLVPVCALVVVAQPASVKYLVLPSSFIGVLGDDVVHHGLGPVGSGKLLKRLSLLIPALVIIIPVLQPLKALQLCPCLL